MDTTPMKPRVLALLDFAWQQEQAMTRGLSGAERNARGTPERWGAKDYLANILLWKRLQTQKLATALLGEQPPVWNDAQLVHQINHQAFLDSQDRSFEDIQAEAARVYEAFVAQVERLSEAEFTDPGHYAWQSEPLWRETLGNGLWHPAHQLTLFYLQSEQRDRAIQLQEALVAVTRQAELPPEDLG